MNNLLAGQVLEETMENRYLTPLDWHKNCPS